MADRFDEMALIVFAMSVHGIKSDSNILDELAAYLRAEFGKDDHEFERGYFCAVAVLTKQSDDTSLIKELFRSGGDFNHADKEDIDTFIEHELISKESKQNE